MQVLSASHVSLDPKLELMLAGKYFNHAEKQLQETIRYVFPE
jgi:hypothetical protein